MRIEGTKGRWSGVFFFFQAEDGIRDGTVTGVQTCALPILCLEEAVGLGTTTVTIDDQIILVGYEGLLFPAVAPHADQGEGNGCNAIPGGLRFPRDQFQRLRSEERRVGKECRARSSRRRRMT